MKHAFHPEALVEYASAVRGYEESRLALGARFIEQVEAAIMTVCESPERWPVLEQDIRRCLTRIFPFAILYSIEGEYVLILAVMHCHRKPRYWRTRVETASPK
jgi:toxin ParE1/3/4